MREKRWRETWVCAQVLEPTVVRADHVISVCFCARLQGTDNLAHFSVRVQAVEQSVSDHKFKRPLTKPQRPDIRNSQLGGLKLRKEISRPKDSYFRDVEAQNMSALRGQERGVLSLSATDVETMSTFRLET